jgi:exodeoxyribonuclease VII small subunit
MARKKSTPEEEGNPTFEEALSGLESIVEAMEHEHLTLEELVTHYEQGSALLNRCESMLQSARQRIELITLRNQNEISLDDSAKPAKSDDDSNSPDIADDSDDENNDIRLF